MRGAVTQHFSIESYEMRKDGSLTINTTYNVKEPATDKKASNIVNILVKKKQFNIAGYPKDYKKEFYSQEESLPGDDIQDGHGGMSQDLAKQWKSKSTFDLDIPNDLFPNEGSLAEQNLLQLPHNVMKLKGPIENNLNDEEHKCND